MFYSQLSEVIVDGNHVKSIEVISKSGKQVFMADVFIDCTGDADLINLAGGQFIKKDKLQNCSILFRIGGVDLEQFYEDLKTGEKVKGFNHWHTRVIRAEKCDSDSPSLVHIAGHLTPIDNTEITFTAVSLRDKEIFLNATRSVGFSETDATDVSNAEINERRNVIHLFKLMKENVPAFKDAVLLYTSPVGFRETRNIIGDYILTREDVLEAKSFCDGVTRGAYPMTKWRAYIISIC